MTVAPDTYPNPRGDNAWDNDAVHWLLEHPDVSAVFTRHDLAECTRRQPKRLENDLDNVILAAKICERYGVDQIQVVDRAIGKTVWRLRRTDPDAPEYPPYGEASAATTQMVTTSDDVAAANRLLRLVPEYAAELTASGKSPNTVFTYTDRAERFLRRVARP